MWPVYNSISNSNNLEEKRRPRGPDSRANAFEHAVCGEWRGCTAARRPGRIRVTEGLRKWPGCLRYITRPTRGPVGHWSAK